MNEEKRPYRTLRDLTSLIIFACLLQVVIFIGSGFFIDGDEAVFGTMVSKLLSVGTVPIFFYGQNYGFVSAEVLAAGLTGYFFGSSIYTLKTAMFLFWLVSFVLLYFIGLKIFSRWKTILFLLLVTAVPVWLDWSTKARGGYLTSLLLANAVILLILSKKNIFKTAAIGLCLPIIYYAQPLWLIILIPFIIYSVIKEFEYKSILALFFAALISWGLFSFIFHSASISNSPQNKLGLNMVGTNLKNLPYNLQIAYSGRFFDSSPGPMTMADSIISGLFIGMFVLSALFNIYLIARKKYHAHDLLFLSATLLYLSFIIFSREQEFSYRYLLPFFVPAAALIVLTLNHLRLKWYPLISGLLIILSSFSIFNWLLNPTTVFPRVDDGQTEVLRIYSLTGFLDSKDINCAYNLDWMITWHLYYFSPPLISRSRETSVREPENSRLTDQLLLNGGHCAIIGYWYHLPVLARIYELQNIFVVSHRYTVVLEPKIEELTSLGFQLGR